MAYKYEVAYSIDAGAALPSVGDLLKQVNDAVSNGGPFEPRLTARVPFIRATVTTERELTPEDIDKMKPILLTSVQKAFPAYDVQIESFRRKSGNAQQLVVQ